MKSHTFAVKGMHCASCEFVIQHEVKKEKGVFSAVANHKKKTVCITSDDHVNIAAINERIKKHGYTLFSAEAKTRTTNPFSGTKLGFLLVILLIALSLFKYFNATVGKNFAFQEMSIMVALLLGIVASLSTCMATTGVFFLSLSRAEGKTPEKSRSFTSLFSLGRVCSYGLFGGLIGFFGKSFMIDPRVSGVFTIIISFFMILIALSFLNIHFFSWRLNMHRLVDRCINYAQKYPRFAPFILGGATFFMPCGFTQSLQLFALQSGGFLKGATFLGVFALGTVPSLFGISLVSNLAGKSYARSASFFSGALILFFSFYNISNGAALVGFAPFLKQQGKQVEGVFTEKEQIVEMEVDSRGYSPAVLTVRKDIPVVWKIKGTDVLGCQSFLVVPKLGITKRLEAGENIITFTPQEKGPLVFSCGMGMYRGKFEVI
ncbi:MAG TPA: sulfite exporter TauE/SafE family protein [Patescibacteria group bacterium]|nr:sulfite exporter TauE/SafE family protein [Patescibacteria group bacterium]